MLRVQIDSFSYPDKKEILNGISLQLKPGEHLALMGESGSGKSTILKLIYGLLHLEKGHLFWNNTPLLGPNFNLVPGETFIKYLSQDFDLMPFTTVDENIGKHLSVFERETHAERIQELLALVNLESFSQTKVRYLSGGQQQRVALAQALAQEPKLLLLDEPFSQIDSFHKTSIGKKVYHHLKSQGIAVVTASHSAGDILPYANRIAVVQKGKIVADGKTKNVYKNPPNLYTALLFGEVNQIPFALVNTATEKNTMLLIYPHELKTSKNGVLKVTVEQSLFMGSHYSIKARTALNTSLYFQSRKKRKVSSEVLLKIKVKALERRVLLIS